MLENELAKAEAHIAEAMARVARIGDIADVDPGLAQMVPIRAAVAEAQAELTGIRTLLAYVVLTHGAKIGLQSAVIKSAKRTLAEQAEAEAAAAAAADQAAREQQERLDAIAANIAAAAAEQEAREIAEREAAEAADAARLA